MGVGAKNKYTKQQGQYLAFIYYYTKIHGYPPAEVDMQRYFNVSSSSVHQMVVTLEKKGLIKKLPHKARSIHLLLPSEQLPNLE
jgi:repressor LexA